MMSLPRTAALLLALSIVPTPAIPLQYFYTPESFGAVGDGVANDAPAFNAAMTSLSANGGGVILLTCGHRYLWDLPYSGNGLSLVDWKDKVSMKGCGPNAPIVMAPNVNKSSAQFAHMLGSYLPTTITGQWVRDVYFDYNGSNNSCGGTCWSVFNGIVTVEGGLRVDVSHNWMLNNSGGTSVLAGRNKVPATLRDFTANENYFDNGGDRVNPASTDFSSLWVTADGYSLVGNTFERGPIANGAAIEMHGQNGAATANKIKDHFNGVNIANETTSPDGPNSSYTLSFSGNVLRGVTRGVTVWAKPGASMVGVVVNGNDVQNVGDATYGYCVDADGNVFAGSNAIGLSITANVCHAPMVASSSSNAAIRVGAWASFTVAANHVYNSPGPAIDVTPNIIAGYTVGLVSGNVATNPGIGPTKIGIRGQGAAKSLSYVGNVVSGTGLSIGISNSVNAAGGIAMNTITGATTKVVTTGPIVNGTNY